MDEMIGQTVFATGDAGCYVSLRRPGRPRRERYEMGRALRDRTPRASLGDWQPPADRADPIDLIRHAQLGRVDWLVPGRVGRMVASPFAFLRGSANIMAADFATLPYSGITPIICGDAHLGNFGFYASPERQLVFDLNDFDEAHPGPWEWDLRRLTVSVWVAGRQNGSSERACAEAVSWCVEQYQSQIAALAEQPLLARSYDRLDVDRMMRSAPHTALRDEIEISSRRARKRTGDRALPRI